MKNLIRKSKNYKTHGFTLAEVLITLTIIGVIAALTIPNLISKYQKHVFYVGAQKAYNTLTNYIAQRFSKTGCPSGDFECAGFVDNYYNTVGFNIAYLDGKIINDFGIVKTISASEIREKYPYYTISNGKKQKKTNFIVSTAYITKDGMLWYFDGSHVIGDVMSNPMYVNTEISIDTNGPTKGPNVLGLDVVTFVILPIDRNGAKAGIPYPFGSKLSQISYVNQPCGEKYINPNCTARMFEKRKIDY